MTSAPPADPLAPAEPAAPARRPRRVADLPLWTMVPPLLWYAALFVVPLAVIVVIALGTPVGYSGVRLGFDVRNLAATIDSVYLTVFARTIAFALLGTVLVVLAGFPTAYWLARFGGRHQALVLTLIVVPFWTSFLLRTFAFIIVLSPDWFLARALRETGLVTDFSVLGSNAAILLAIVYNYLPLVVLPVYATLERMDWRLVEAAEDLGASPAGAFRQVTLPTVRRGVLTAALLVFVPMTGEYIIPSLLGSGKNVLFANLIGQQFLEAQNWPLGAALAVLLVVAVGVAAVALLLSTQRDDA